MKPIISICTLFLLIFFTNAIIINGRCGSSEYELCTSGDCYTYDLELFYCASSPFWDCSTSGMNSTTPVLGPYYYLTEMEGGYLLRTYESPICTGIATSSSEVYCDNCINWDDTAFCNTFYLECGEVFIASITIILLIGFFIVGIILLALIFCGSIAFYLKRKQESSLEKTPILEITNEQATYQNSPYSYDTAVFRGTYNTYTY